MSRRVIRAGLFAIACLTAGCAERGASSPVGPEIFRGPHGGVTIALPDGKGYAEVVNEGDGRRARTNVAVVTYFLGPDKQSPMTPLPTNLKIKIGEGDTAKTVPLTPSPKSGDPLSSSRLASANGPYAVFDQRCTLTGAVNGESFSLEFDGGRLR
jgi:hypothetical protein